MKTFVHVVACIAVAALVACGGHKTTTVSSSSGEATVTQDANGQSVTVKSSGNTVTVGASVDPSQLGVPMYPGARTNSAGTVSYTGADAGAMAAFNTPDSFEKVYDFYKSKLPADSEKMKMDSQEGSVAEFVVLAAEGETSVQITGKSGLTQIIITHKAK